MGLILGLIKFFIKLLLYFAIFAAVIIFIPNLPPYTKFTSIQLEPTQQRIGSLAPNDLLNNAEKLYEGKLLGPEAFQIYNGELYTSLATGEIVKVSSGGHVTFVTKLGQPCTGLTQEHKCGRPLGFEIDKKTNTLYVADAYHGIWKVDLKTDKKQLLVSPQVPIEGRQPKLFNSIVLGENGDIYWTDSTTDFHLKDGAIGLLTAPSGRVLHYNAAKNQSKVLVDNVWFANGIVLSHDNQFLVFSETAHLRLMKYYINGPKRGKLEVFAAGLPGTPDNIRVLPDKSGILVGLYSVFDDDNPLLTKTMATTPLVRKFLARLQRLIEIPFEYLNNIYPHVIFEEIVYKIGHFQSVSGLVPSITGLLQLDWNGNIVASYFNTDQSLNHISDAIIYNGKLHTGSPHVQNFIGSLPAPPLLLKAFSDKRVEQQIPKVVQKPEQVKVQEIKSKIPKPEEKTAPNVVKPVDAPKLSIQTPHEKKPEIKQMKSEAQPTPTEPVKTKPTQEEPSVNPTAKPEIKVKPKTDTKPTPKPETKPSTTPEIKSNPKPETKPTPKPETKPTPKPESKQTPKPESKQNPKPETKPTPKPETKPSPTPETKPTPKPETKPTPKPETKPTPKPETKPTPKPETKPTPQPETKQPSPKPDTKLNSHQETKPEMKDAPKIKPTIEPELKTTPPSKSAEHKPTVVKQEVKDKTAETKKTNDVNQKQEKPNKNQIPIKEDIQSDTKKPNTEKLKVIKKGGPTEIPNPEL